MLLGLFECLQTYKGCGMWGLTCVSQALLAHAGLPLVGGVNMHEYTTPFPLLPVRANAPQRRSTPRQQYLIRRRGGLTTASPRHI